MKTIFRYHEMMPRGCNGTEQCCRTSCQSRMEWALSSEQSGLPWERGFLGLSVQASLAVVGEL